MNYLLPDNVYNILKWVGLVFLPALASFISAIGPAWGWDVTAIVTTVAELGTFIGACIAVSEIAARRGL